MTITRLHLKNTLVATLFALALGTSLFAGTPAPRKDSSTTVAAVRPSDADTMRIEGEKRFHANCGRCHAAPQKFPPRMMATVLRHMRVRATITDEDRRMILFYMTQ